MEDLWRETRRGLDRLPARRYLAATVVTLLGVTASTWTWTRARDLLEEQFEHTVAQLADRAALAIEAGLARDVEALRDLSTSSQLFGVTPDEEAWKFQTGGLLGHFPGIRWMRWRTIDGSENRAVSQPGIVAPELETQEGWPDDPLPLVSDHWNGDYHVRTVFPVRHVDRAGILFGEIVADSAWVANHIVGLDYQLVLRLSMNAESASAWGTNLAEAPSVVRPLHTPAGSTLRLGVWPTPAFREYGIPPWPELFLATGVVLSICLGLVIFQFLRLRDYSQALVETNRDLDAQIEGLSRRDGELRQLTEELESRVAKRTSELSDALRRLETFSRSVSHDLRSPIGAIINFAGVLDEDYGDRIGPEGRRIVGRIVAAGERTSRLLTGLVEFSASVAPAAGGRPLDVRSIAERAFAEVIAQDPAPHSVRFALESVPPAYGDPNQTLRVFVNLLGNALKYSLTRETREIRVGAEEGQPHNTYFVQDNGPGFDQQQAEEIFEPLRRLHGEDTEGAGLGLAIVSRLVEQWGGRAWATSDGVTGATFFFTLPRTREEPA